jgi:hypothetical protein
MGQCRGEATQAGMHTSWSNSGMLGGIKDYRQWRFLEESMRHHRRVMSCSVLVPFSVNLLLYLFPLCWIIVILGSWGLRHMRRKLARTGGFRLLSSCAGGVGRWPRQIPPPHAVDRVPPSRDHSAAYNGAGSVDMAWEHEPLSSFREATACSSLGCDRGFRAKFPSHRRQIVGRCTCPETT